jgi:hypothetical protein
MLWQGEHMLGTNRAKFSHNLVICLHRLQLATAAAFDGKLRLAHPRRAADARLQKSTVLKLN